MNLLPTELSGVGDAFSSKMTFGFSYMQAPRKLISYAGCQLNSLAVVQPASSRRLGLAGSISTIEYAGKVETWIVMRQAETISKEMETVI